MFDKNKKKLNRGKWKNGSFVENHKPADEARLTEVERTAASLSDRNYDLGNDGALTFSATERTKESGTNNAAVKAVSKNLMDAAKKDIPTPIKKDAPTLAKKEKSLKKIDSMADAEEMPKKKSASKSKEPKGGKKLKKVQVDDN